MVDRQDVCVLVPTYDEAATIGEVLDRFAAEGFEHLLVIDGGSSDGTREIAADHGARVVQQSGSGKGQAIREAVGLVDQPYVLMVDGDATYRPEEADRLLEPLLSGEADHVIGNRFANMESEAMSGLNRVGNRIINRAFSFIHGRDFGDILSGYRAFTRDSMESFSLSADGFGIETELSVECVKHNVPTAVVPITYEARPETSETNLHPLKDGAVILLTLYQLAKTNNPLFYFGSLGVASGGVGLALAAFVGVRWFVYDVSHEVLALVSGVALLFGVQLVMFGVLSDLIVTLNREQTRRFEHFARRIGDEAGLEAPEAAESAAVTREPSIVDDGDDSDGVADENDDEAPETDGDDGVSATGEASAPE